MKIISLLKKHAIFFILAAIIFSGLTSYLSALPGDFLWDDHDGIVNNIYIKDWRYLPQIFTQSLTTGSGATNNYWRPILSLAYAAQWHAWGGWAPGFHAVNIFFHLLNAILVFFFIRRLFSSAMPAAIAALLFAVHPLQTEAVTFISGLGDPLSLFFMLAGLIIFTRLRQNKKSAAGLIFGYGAIFILFSLALMTKERSVVFPVLLVITDLFIWQTKESSKISFKSFFKNSGVRAALFMAGTLGYLALRATILNFINTFNIYGSNNYYTEHLSVRLFTFLKTIPIYGSLILYPVKLHMSRFNELIWSINFFEPAVLLGAGLILTLGLLAVFTFRKQPAYSFGALWFLASLFPSSGIIIPVAGTIYEHYLYAPLIGLFLIAGLIGERLWIKTKNLWRPLLIIGFILMIILLGVQTARRNNDWKDAISIFSNTLKYSPGDSRLWNDLGISYQRADRFSESEEAYLKAISLAPDQAIHRYNLGNLYYQTGRFDESAEQYKTSIYLDPSYVRAYQSLFRLYSDYRGEAQAHILMQELKPYWLKTQGLN